MNAKRTVKKILALGAGIAMVGATVTGALAYNLANYPTPFVQSGVFSGGKIVVGERASTQDVMGAIDIAASLQRSAVSKIDLPGAAGTVSLSGDSFKVERSSDLLEMREVIGDVYDTLTDTEIEALAGGSLSTDQGTTDYNQYLRFADNSSTVLQKMAVNYLEDESNKLGDYLVVESGLPFYEWELEFSEGLESSIDDATPDVLSDIEDQTLNMLGKDYSVVKATIDTTANDVTLTLMAGDVSSTMREGETKTFTINGVEYEVSLIFVSDPNSGSSSAKFMVNGEVTDSLADGETDTLSGGVQIGVRDLLVNSREGVVEFFLGADKVEFTDTSYNNTLMDGSVEINNENIEDAEVDVVVNEIGTDNAEITSIKYRLQSDAKVGTTVYIPAGKGVREFLDEPIGMIGGMDLRYEGLTTVKTNDIKMSSRSDHSYDLELTSTRGKTYKFPYATAKDSVAKFGDDNDDLVFLEAANSTTWNIGDDDYFVLSESAVGSASEKDSSAVLRYDDIDTSDNTISFSDMSSGETVTVSYTPSVYAGGGLGVANNFVVEGKTYKIWVEDAAVPRLAIDQDGDGTANGARVGFTVRGGGIVDFANQISGAAPVAGDVGNGQTLAGNDVNLTVATPSAQFDDSSLGGDLLTWTVDVGQATADQVDVDFSSYSGPHEDSVNNGELDDFDLWSDESNDDYDRAYTDFGAKLDVYNPTGNNDAAEFTIAYPEAERGAQVFVVAGKVTRSESGSSGSADKVNPIAVGLAVLDKNAPAVGTANMIVVGGPCANTVAAKLLENPAECGAGFVAGKAMIKSFENAGKVAILVAGYESQETLGASYVLANFGDYTLSGAEVEVVVADLNSISVNKVA